MRFCETIIVGGGISGLACARSLFEHNNDFLVLTKDIGGRMKTFPGNVNAGASYMNLDYKNVRRFVGLGKHLFTHDCFFFDGSTCSRLWNWRNLWYMRKLFKLYWLVREFRLHLNELRAEALNEQQYLLLKRDPLLMKYMNQSAVDFVNELGINELNQKYFNPLLRSTAYASFENVNAFSYLHNLLPWIVPTFTCDFSNTIAHLTDGFQHRIKRMTVRSVRRNAGHFVVRTDRGEYLANNVVLAACHNDLKKVYPVPKPTHENPIYVLNVKGKRKNIHNKERVVFINEGNCTIMWRQANGTDVVFSFVPRPNLQEFYTSYRIIKSVHWKTAVVISRRWVKQDLGKGLYLASDYNISGLEDAYITGIYAANQILKTQSNAVARI